MVSDWWLEVHNPVIIYPLSNIKKAWTKVHTFYLLKVYSWRYKSTLQLHSSSNPQFLPNSVPETGFSGRNSLFLRCHFAKYILAYQIPRKRSPREHSSPECREKSRKPGIGQLSFRGQQEDSRYCWIPLQNWRILYPQKKTK